MGIVKGRWNILGQAFRRRFFGFSVGVGHSFYNPLSFSYTLFYTYPYDHVYLSLYFQPCKDPITILQNIWHKVKNLTTKQVYPHSSPRFVYPTSFPKLRRGNYSYHLIILFSSPGLLLFSKKGREGRCERKWEMK